MIQQQSQQKLITDLTLNSRENVSSDKIAEILRTKYLNDLTYTNLSPSILIALNPYQRSEINLTQDYILEYKDTANAKVNQWREPHLYQLVNHAYLHMRRTSSNQSILFQ
jgi:chitin synthase